MARPADLPKIGWKDKDALIQALFTQLAGLKDRVEQLAAENAGLCAENARLRAENAALQAKLTLPPKPRAIPVCHPRADTRRRRLHPRPRSRRMRALMRACK